MLTQMFLWNAKAVARRLKDLKNANVKYNVVKQSRTQNKIQLHNRRIKIVL